MDTRQPFLFALGATRVFGESVAAALGLALASEEEREFEDGEHKARPLDDVHGRDVYVAHSLYADEQQSGNDKLCRLLFFIGALRDAGAARVTALVPYLCYARKDRRTNDSDPVTSRYVASLFEAVGVDAVVTIDVHNPAAFDNAFRCASVRLEGQSLFVPHIAPSLRGRDVTVLSPDEGGMKRADAFRRGLAQALGVEVELGFMEKTRKGGVVSGERLYAAVERRDVVIVDDIISTGTTLLRAAQACRRLGASSVCVAATHGIFVGDADRVLQDPAIDRVVVSDSIPPFRLRSEASRAKLSVVPAGPLFAETVRNLRGERI